MPAPSAAGGAAPPAVDIREVLAVRVGGHCQREVGGQGFSNETSQSGHSSPAPSEHNLGGLLPAVPINRMRRSGLGR
jgi:hypothetical protein